MRLARVVKIQMAMHADLPRPQVVKALMMASPWQRQEAALRAVRLIKRSVRGVLG